MERLHRIGLLALIGLALMVNLVACNDVPDPIVLAELRGSNLTVSYEKYSEIPEPCLTIRTEVDDGTRGRSYCPNVESSVIGVGDAIDDVEFVALGFDGTIEISAIEGAAGPSDYRAVSTDGFTVAVALVPLGEYTVHLIENGERIALKLAPGQLATVP